MNSVNQNGDTAIHVCIERNSISSFVTIFNFYNEKLEKLTEEEDKDKLKEEIKKAFNMQNKDGNTILHFGAIYKRE